MTGEWILLIVGAALLLMGALWTTAWRRGGTHALAGSAARGALAGTGVLCVSAGLILMGSADARPASGATPVKAKIANELGPGQISEHIRVLLDGRDAGVLAVDRRTPKAQLTVTVGHAGRHDYRLVSLRHLDGQRPTRRTSGGEVVIDGVHPLVLYSDDAGRVYLGQ